MSLQSSLRCVAILLISTGLSAQEPSVQRNVGTPTPRVIVIETTPDIERSEVLRKVIEALEKEGTAKRVSEDRPSKQVGYLAQISARPDTPSEALQKLIKELQAVGIEKFSLRSTNEAESSVTITAPADVPYRNVRRIADVLAKHPQFEIELLMSENNAPVTPTLPQSPVPTATLPRISTPDEQTNLPRPAQPNAFRPAPAKVAPASVVKVFALKNSHAATVARIVEQLFRPETSAAAEEKTNSLIVRGPDKRIEEIAALLAEIEAAVRPASGGAPAETSPAGHGLKVHVPTLGPTPLATDLNEGASPSKVFSFHVGVLRESADELRKRSQALEQQSRELAEQLKGPFPNQREAESKKELLRSTVQQAFAARQALLRAENAELAKRLHALQQSIEIRDRVSQQIIDRRIDDLLNPHKQWNVEPPAANVPYRETTLAEPPLGDANKLLVHRSENSVKVEGHFDGNEEIILVIGDSKLTGVANTAPEPKDVKELKWTTPVNKAGDYVIELRSEAVKIDGGTTAPGLAFEVHNVPNTVQGTSYISFTGKDPLPNGKVVIAVPQTKLMAKRKTNHVLVTVGHVELPDNPTVVPINIVIRRKDGTNSEVKTYQSIVPADGRVPPLNANVLPGTDRDSRRVPQPTGKQLGTVLGKPIHESDLKNTSTADNLKRLLLLPLTEDYCRKHKLDRADELKAKVTDERRRAMVQLFLLPAQLHRHLYEKHGGRVILSAFGPTPVDALKKWLEEREQAKDFELTDPDLKGAYRELWMQIPADARFASPDQIKSAFDPALSDHFIGTFLNNVAPDNKTSRAFPVDTIKGHIASIKQRTGVAAAVEELRKITGLDYGNGVEPASRQDWLDWWDDETSNIDSAKDGLREYVITGVVAIPNGQPIVGATVQAHVPFKGSPSGQYQLATTRADLSGRYVLAMGIPLFATPEELAWSVSVSAHHLPGYVAGELPVTMKLHLQTPDNTDNVTEQFQDTLERNNDTIFAGLPVAKNFKVQPVAKPIRPAAGTKPSPKTKPPVPPKSPEKVPDNKADDSHAEARRNNGQTKVVIGKISYSLPFSFPSVDSILNQLPAGKARPKLERIECELVKYQVSDARRYPLVGLAQLAQAHFKSTITSEAGREVAFSDSSHLIRVLE